MTIRIKNIRLDHRTIAGKHVITSPDVPGLHVAHADAETALACVQPTLDKLAEMRERVAKRRRVEKFKGIAAK